MNKRWTIALITIIATLMLDQIIKIWVKTNMALEETTMDIGFFRLLFIENNGMAFGTEFGGENGKLALTLFRLVAISLIGYYLYTLVKKKAHMGLIFSVGLIFAGAFGNIIDSVFYGLFFDSTCPCSREDALCFLQYDYCSGLQISEITEFGSGYASVFHGQVVDMFQFTVEWPDWMPYVEGKIFPPIFNLADASISIGLAIIIIRSRRFFPDTDKSGKNWFGFRKRGKQKEAKSADQADQIS